MKITGYILIAAILVCSSMAVSGGETAIIPISPYLSEGEKAEVRSDLLRHLLEKASPGNCYTVLDGWTGHVVANFSVPELRYESRRARQIAMREPLGKLSKWFSEGADSANGLHDTGAIDTPSVVQSIGRLNGDAVLAIGSPVYRNPLQEEHSWFRNQDGHAQWVFPSDAALSTEGGFSPWATYRGSGALAGMNIHWLEKGDTSYPKGRYLDRVQRFLALFFDKHDGTLVSFLGDTDEAFRGLFREDLRAFSFTINQEDDVLEMFTAASEEIAVRGEREVPQIIVPEIQVQEEVETFESAPIAEEFVVEAKSQIVAEAEGYPLAIGIAWEIDGDLDLFYIGPDEEKVVYFGHEEGNHATYIEDILIGDGGFEMINFSKFPHPSSELWVNCYDIRTVSPNVEYGILLIRTPDRIIQRKFAIPSTSGNKAGEFAERGSNINWISVPWKEVLGLSGEEMSQ